MSSILNALKKLEQETAQNNESSVRHNDAVKITHSRTLEQVRGRRIRVGMVLMVIAAGALIALIAATFKNSSPDANMMQLKSQVKTPGLPAAVKSDDIGNRPVAVALSHKEKIEAGVEKKPQNKLDEDVPVKRENPLQADNDRLDKKKTRPVPSEKTEPDSPPALLSTTAAKDLKIQAIAWSPDPKKRMAVINSRIVREGGSIENIVVIQIHPDDIIIRRAGQKETLAFKRK